MGCRLNVRAILVFVLGFLCFPASAAFALTGDVTGDGDLNVADVQCLVLTALDLTPEDPDTDPPCLVSAAAADLDCSAAVNVVDVQLNVQLVLNSLVGVLGYAPSQDGDADGVHDGCDLCPDTWDPDQIDSDADGVGDACDGVGGEGEGEGCEDICLNTNDVCTQKCDLDAGFAGDDSCFDDCKKDFQACKYDCGDGLEILCDNGDLEACCDLGDPSACCELGDLNACCETGDAIACCETGDPAVDCQVAGGDCESIPCNQGLTCLSGICVYAAGQGEDCSTENTVCESDLECVDGICVEPVCVPDCGQVDPDCVSMAGAACLMKDCGPDGCGGTCGTCPFSSSCLSNGICYNDGGGSDFCPCGCDQSEAMAADIDKLDKEPALLEIQRILTIQAEREYLVGYITEAMITHRLRLLDLATRKMGQAPPLPKPSARALALRQLRNERPAVTNNRLQVRTEMIAYGDYREKIQGKDKHYPAAFRLWMEVTNLTGEPLTLVAPILASSVPLPVSRWFLEDTTGTPFDGRLKRGETKSILVIGDMGEPVKAGVEFDVNVRFDTLEIPIHVRTLDSAGSLESLLLSANDVEKLGDLFRQ